MGFLESFMTDLPARKEGYGEEDDREDILLMVDRVVRGVLPLRGPAEEALHIRE